MISDCKRFIAALDNLVQHASQTYPVSRFHQFEAWRIDNGYRLREDAKELDSQLEPQRAASVISAHMNDLALAALPEFTKIHAGCANWRGKRLVAAGPSRSGKTTLMTRLLYEGFAVHCDDIVLLRHGEVLPFPRRFWIRPHALPLLPQIAPLDVAAPENRRHLVLDPAERGFEWQIHAAPADVVLFLERNHASVTQLLPCPKHAMAKLIMSNSSLPGGGPQEWVRDVCTMLDNASTYVLRCGSLNSVVDAVKEALEPVGARTCS